MAVKFTAGMLVIEIGVVGFDVAETTFLPPDDCTTPLSIVLLTI